MCTCGTLGSTSCGATDITSDCRRGRKGILTEERQEGRRTLSRGNPYDTCARKKYVGENNTDQRRGIVQHRSCTQWMCKKNRKKWEEEKKRKEKKRKKGEDGEWRKETDR